MLVVAARSVCGLFPDSDRRAERFDFGVAQQCAVIGPFGGLYWLAVLVGRLVRATTVRTVTQLSRASPSTSSRSRLKPTLVWSEHEDATRVVLGLGVDSERRDGGGVEDVAVNGCSWMLVSPPNPSLI